MEITELKLTPVIPSDTNNDCIEKISVIEAHYLDSGNISAQLNLNQPAITSVLTRFELEDCDFVAKKCESAHRSQIDDNFLFGAKFKKHM